MGQIKKSVSADYLPTLQCTHGLSRDGILFQQYPTAEILTGVRDLAVHALRLLTCQKEAAGGKGHTHTHKGGTKTHERPSDGVM